MNYYNEFDKNAALWLAQLAANGLIPAGHIDTRSISEVVPSDLAGYTLVERNGKLFAQRPRPS